MADKPLVFWNFYVNAGKTREETYKYVDANGDVKEGSQKVGGEPELGYADPETGSIVFASDLANKRDVPAGPSIAPAGDLKRDKREAIEAQPAPDLPLEVASEAGEE